MSVRPLSNILQKLANLELNEVPERLEDDIKFVREWLGKQPYLDVDVVDQWIINYLRGCKFSLNKTTEKIDYFFTVKCYAPEFFENRDPLSSVVQEVLKQGIFIPVRKVADGIPGKILIVWGRVDPGAVRYISIVKVLLMFMEVLMMEDDNYTVCGFELVSDMKGFPFCYVAQLTPAILKKVSLILQRAYPMQIPGMLYFNSPPQFDLPINLFKQFMSAPLKDKIKSVGEIDLSVVYKDTPITGFPVEYGGENGHLDDIAAQWKIKMESHRDWFLKDQKQMSDESKRLGPSCAEGTFRKVIVD